MVQQRAISPEYSEGLGKWIALPFLGLAVCLVGIFLGLAGTSCAAPDPGMTPGRIFFLACGGSAIGALLVGAIYRLGVLIGLGRFRAVRDGGLLAAASLLLLLTFTRAPGGSGRHGYSYAPHIYAGFGVILVSLAYLLAAAARGQRADDAGALVCVYLVTVDVFVLLPMLWFVWDASHGALC